MSESVAAAGPHAGSYGRRPITLGISLKLYLDIPQSVEWARQVAQLAGSHPAVHDGRVQLFALPSLSALGPVRDSLQGSGVAVGAQDLHWADRGPYTGAVSGADLRQSGCELVEVGHAERRRLFGDDDSIVRAKFAAAIRNDLTPVLCVGERTRTTAPQATADCVSQLDSALEGLTHPDSGDVIVAYEPEWAIGAAEPASADIILAVAAGLRRRLGEQNWITTSSVIYGGSAQFGVLSDLGDGVDGLFLGRFAHDPRHLASILDEAAALR